MAETRGKLSVVIVPDEWNGKFTLADLRHPRSNSSALYAFDGDKKRLAEVVTVDDEKSSWFIGNTVESDGRVNILSCMDPALLVLPYLRSATRKIPLDHLLHDDDFPLMDDLVPMLTSNIMNCIANPIGSVDLNVWQWNEEKTMEHLSGKIKRLCEEIKRQGLTADSAASSDYVSGKNEESPEERQRLAWQMLSDSLEEEVSQKLAKHLDIKLQPQTKKNTTEEEEPMEQQEVTSAKKGAKGPKEDFSKAYKKSLAKSAAKEPVNSKQKALQKSAAGSKNIMSFFNKK